MASSAQSAPATGVANPSESDIYDRQIRLWGAEAQSKMASAKVLYINMSGISSEIMKNLILAGIRGAIADGRSYPDAVSETPSSFLPPHERLAEKKESDEPEAKRQKKMSVAKTMQPHVLELNPLLEECEINEEEIDSIPDEYFSKFDIVIASKMSLEQAIRISNATTRADGKFYFVHSFGFYACALIDLGVNHTYRKETGKDKLSDVMKISPYLSLDDMTKKDLSEVKDRWHKSGPPMIYTKYRTILNFLEQKKEYPTEESANEFVTFTKEFLKSQGLEEGYIGSDDDLKDLAKTANAEVSPVCAVIGGVIGNEVIKAISGKGEPANNMLLFDGTTGGCSVFTLK